MIIFVPHITPRISFTLDLMIGRILNSSYTITQDLEEFNLYEGAKIAYTPEPTDSQNVIWIEAIPLLFENYISKQTIIPTEWNGYTLFFPTPKGSFPIDLFAVSFFLTTRYEEYYPDIVTDHHKRFPAKASVSYQLGFHRKPIVNILAEALAEKIQKQYPNFQYHLPKFESITTYDVDIAYKYRGKGLYRWSGSMLKSLLKLDFYSVSNLLKATFNLDHTDTFDRFRLHNALAIKEQNTPIHFILTAPFSKFDKNIDPKRKTFKKLIEKLEEFSEIGLHPSYHSSENLTLIAQEKERLENRSHLKISKTRQHFLKFRFPSTFEALCEAGFEEDYSLGWQDEAGFRTSTTVPIPFFNVTTNQIRPLILFPLHAMDGALYHCYNTMEECLSVIDTLREEVEKHGGVFIILYHNNSEKHLF